METNEMTALFENENNVLAELAGKFGLDTSGAKVARRRIYLTVQQSDCMEVIESLKDGMGFTHLCAITGLDNGQQLEFLYHLANEAGMAITVKFIASGRDDITIPSVLPIFPGATFYELELEGLLGVTVDGLPKGRQYPLPDNWPKDEHPLRKDWTPGPRQTDRNPANVI